VLRYYATGYKAKESGVKVFDHRAVGKRGKACLKGYNALKRFSP
jgi:hypothetical protein